MKHLVILLALLLTSCSNSDSPTETTPTNNTDSLSIEVFFQVRNNFSGMGYDIDTTYRIKRNTACTLPLNARWSGNGRYDAGQLEPPHFNSNKDHLVMARWPYGSVSALVTFENGSVTEGFLSGSYTGYCREK